MAAYKSAHCLALSMLPWLETKLSSIQLSLQCICASKPKLMPNWWGSFNVPDVNIFVSRWAHSCLRHKYYYHCRLSRIHNVNHLYRTISNEWLISRQRHQAESPTCGMFFSVQCSSCLETNLSIELNDHILVPFDEQTSHFEFYGRFIIYTSLLPPNEQHVPQVY